MTERSVDMWLCFCCGRGAAVAFGSDVHSLRPMFRRSIMLDIVIVIIIYIRSNDVLGNDGTTSSIFHIQSKAFDVIV